MKIDIGNRIYRETDRAPEEIINKFIDIPSSNIGDVMNRLYCMRSSIKRYGKTEKNLLGSAITVKIPDGDNAFIHMALDLAEEGDVLVVDGNGCLSRSVMGEIMFTYAQNKKLAGIIVDGAIRDVDSLFKLDIPVYACAVTPQGPYKHGPGEINVPVSCGGQVVFPGDIIAGDADGICVIRKNEAKIIAEAAEEKYRIETKLLNSYHETGNNTEQHKEFYKKISDSLNTAIC